MLVSEFSTTVLDLGMSGLSRLTLTILLLRRSALPLLPNGDHKAYWIPGTMILRNMTIVYANCRKSEKKMSKYLNPDNASTTVFTD